MRDFFTKYKLAIIVCFIVMLVVAVIGAITGNLKDYTTQEENIGVITNPVIENWTCDSIDDVKESLDAAYDSYKTMAYLSPIENDVITIKRFEEDKTVTQFYIKHSDRYDCATMWENVDDEEPIAVFYYEDYDKLKELGRSMFEYVVYYGTSILDVELYKGEDGQFNISVE